MLTVKDTIKMVKPMDEFDYEGAEFEIINISDSGMITFQSEMGRGVMTYPEFEMYFKRIERPKKEEWSEWVAYDDGVDNINYRRKGGVIEVEIDGGYRGYATCAPKDIFDLEKGISLASARAKVERAEDILQRTLECM